MSAPPTAADSAHRRRARHARQAARLLRTIDELDAADLARGPVHDPRGVRRPDRRRARPLALDTLEAKRTVANIASFMRFAQRLAGRASRGTLAGFVDYLDAYQGAGGELPTSVEASDDVEGVQLMTLYQAKGLEFRNVFVPQLLKDEWPAREYGWGCFPKELLKEAVPAGDIHTEEERRLLYVALTRAQDRLVADDASRARRREGPVARSSTSSRRRRRRARGDRPSSRVGNADGDSDARRATSADVPGARARRDAAQVMPLPTARERRLALRLRATELLETAGGHRPADPEAAGRPRAVRRGVLARWRAAAVESRRRGARASARPADACACVALDSGAGANLLEVASLPSAFSYSQVDTYERCPLQYAFRHVYRIPSSRTLGRVDLRLDRPRRVRGVHQGAARTRSRAASRRRRARISSALFEAEWKPGEFERQDRRGELPAPGRDAARQLLGRRGRNARRGGWPRSSPFELDLEMPDGEPAIFTGMIDRIDRLPSGGIEVIDYKTGRLARRRASHESLQLSIYALACRDALGLGTPEKVTLYFTESATRMSTIRTDEQLDAARDALVDVGRPASAPATSRRRRAPSTCWRCDYAPLCPSRVR